MRRGITPDGGGAYLLPRMIGLAKAKELIFLGDDLAAADAERIGLINTVMSRDELDEAVDEWAGRLATGPTKAISMAKGLLNRSLDSDRPVRSTTRRGRRSSRRGPRTPPRGVQAVIDRRDVQFKGW